MVEDDSVSYFGRMLVPIAKREYGGNMHFLGVRGDLACVLGQVSLEGGPSQTDWGQCRSEKHKSVCLEWGVDSGKDRG